jgi:ribosomal RNA assembly protein
MPSEEAVDIKTVRIPKVRLREMRRCCEYIEKRGNVKIEFGEEVVIKGEPLEVFVAEAVVRAIGRGFDYADASAIFNDYLLYTIPLTKNKKDLIRIRARIIGTSGKIKRKIESVTKTRISVFGKTVSIIGKEDGLERARHAVEKLIEGKTHSMVFKFLEANDKN